ncbi:AI-2E family transporter [Candidatus Roizmanbacteria bacterium]|nr:AI-2E family transporter [Candidatus Roizmanbacteria bacterium]
MVQRIEISYKTILFTIGVLILLWLVVQIRDIVFLVALSIIAASGLRAPVDGLESLKLPRIVAILIVYSALISIVFFSVAGLAPILGRETERLVLVLGDVIEHGSPYIDISPTRLTDQLASVSGNIVKATFGIVSSLVNVFTFFALTFYMLLERRHLRVFLRNLLGEEYKEHIVQILLKLEDRLGAWVRGEISLMILIGFMTYIGLVLLRVDFALPLAILAGFLEIVPMVGPIISAIPAILVASLVSPWLAAAVALLYFIVQQIENHLAVPLVMKRAVGVPPMVSIISILIGARLAGFIGAILAVPFFVSLQVLFEETIRPLKTPEKPV